MVRDTVAHHSLVTLCGGRCCTRFVLSLLAGTTVVPAIQCGLVGEALLSPKPLVPCGGRHISNTLLVPIIWGTVAPAILMCLKMRGKAIPQFLVPGGEGTAAPEFAYASWQGALLSSIVC